MIGPWCDPSRIGDRLGPAVIKPAEAKRRLVEIYRLVERKKVRFGRRKVDIAVVPARHAGFPSKPVGNVWNDSESGHAKGRIGKNKRVRRRKVAFSGKGSVAIDERARIRVREHHVLHERDQEPKFPKPKIEAPRPVVERIGVNEVCRFHIDARRTAGNSDRDGREVRKMRPERGRTKKSHFDAGERKRIQERSILQVVPLGLPQEHRLRHRAEGEARLVPERDLFVRSRELVTVCLEPPAKIVQERRRRMTRKTRRVIRMRKERNRVGARNENQSRDRGDRIGEQVFHWSWKSAVATPLPTVTWRCSTTAPENSGRPPSLPAGFQPSCHSTRL